MSETLAMCIHHIPIKNTCLPCHHYQLTGSPLMVMIKPEQIKELNERLDKLENKLENALRGSDLRFEKLLQIESIVEMSFKDLDHHLNDHDERIDSLENIQAEPRLIEIEKYLRRIDNIALVDPDKVVANEKVLFDKLEKLEEQVKHDRHMQHECMATISKKVEDVRGSRIENKKERYKCPNCRSCGKIQYYVESAKDKSVYLNCLLCQGTGFVEE